MTKKRILIYVASGSELVSFVARLSVLVKRLIHYFSSAIILLFFVLTTFAYTKIFLVIRSLSPNSQNRPHDHVSTGNLKKKKLLLREIKQAKSCFIIVTCFVVCLFPTVVALLSFAFKLLHRFNAEAIRIWAISFHIYVEFFRELHVVFLDQENVAERSNENAENPALAQVRRVLK